MYDNLKYIVLGEMRSGTTVLHESLEQDQQLSLAYEIFHKCPAIENTNIPNASQVLQDIYGIQAFESLKYIKKNDKNKVTPQVESHISDKYKLYKYVDFVFNHYNGFKILYHQLRKENRVWSYLNNIKVIHVIRKNYLDVLYSQMQALTTDIWNTRQECSPPTFSAVIDPYMAEQFFQYMDFQIEYFNKLFPSALLVDYEEINIPTTYAKIQKFLGIEQITIQCKYKKIIKKKNIQNYTELKQHFHRSQWSQFFRQTIY